MEEFSSARWQLAQRAQGVVDVHRGEVRVRNVGVAGREYPIDWLAAAEPRQQAIDGRLSLERASGSVPSDLGGDLLIPGALKNVEQALEAVLGRAERELAAIGDHLEAARHWVEVE
jgi:hypothetical protein